MPTREPRCGRPGPRQPGPARHLHRRRLRRKRCPVTSAQVVTVGGMPGWQITLIAIAAALAAATAAVFLDRVRTSRRSVSATS